MTLAIVSLLAFDAQAQRFQPFIEADTFGPDLQFFAPAEIDTFGDGPAPKRGFYGTYDRLYINVSRPKDAPPDNLGFPQIGDPGTFQSLNGKFGSSEGDWTWGNRYDFGYMTVDNHGWGVSIMNVDGPNSYYTMPQHSIENTIGGGVATATTENRAIHGLQQSLNSGNMSSFELNKIWRAPAFHSGTIFEPMVGIRYTKFTDHFRHDIFGRFDTQLLTGYPDLLAPLETGPWEIIRTRQAWYDNQMLGGQLGFRLYRQLGHWKLTADVKAFAFQNWQFLRIYEEQTAYEFSIVGVRRHWNETREAPIYRDNQEFVWGGEIRVEAAYELTRDISVRCGFMFLDFGKGMGRGGSLVTSDQDVLMAGISMGFTYNY
jgi:hypothetical protein